MNNPVFGLEIKEYIKLIPKAIAIMLSHRFKKVNFIQANKLCILDMNITRTLCML